jgi:hypothetical protein
MDRCMAANGGWSGGSPTALEGLYSGAESTRYVNLPSSRTWAKFLASGADHLRVFFTALQTPFMLLPFRPSSDTVTARTFIRNYFSQSLKRGSPFAGDELAQELRLTDPMVSSLPIFLIRHVVKALTRCARFSAHDSRSYAV